MNAEIDVRPMVTVAEYAGMVDYFLDGGDDFLRGMGVDLARLPSREAWLAAVLADHERADDAKERVYLAWWCDGTVVGHSSLSHIEPGVQGHVHLHLWRGDLRRRGLGRAFMVRSLQHYFARLHLRRILCEPMADNEAPNRTLARLGFRLLRRYRTRPTAIACEQDVNRWELTAEAAAELRADAPE